ncbi:CDP-glycerol:poly(glycerophosphate) glycerophosphotransferase family protein [Niallia circulans]|jgi:CDP-ribitol ribitolphosphotransferase / teichoic acid ribitol-phosphate polymerase|uniref:CDP-glycerol glycerophosphotransferase family protein n=1 Tax=Niallia circulans TaxID=1397 RepID=UPI0009EF4FF2|nr:CDP-glycerol glycerophosphotransferase family protein [Niallia circulans]MCM2981921.1 CDP-glycerol glycerophosphotransferase family protein [Niallia circulans]MDR4316348.1 polyribitolphosphotransferase [Niallia circulans]MED3838481.1 CDP-glycerol glycerophosphotransferase family protein [Niallia circulans]MED4243954.1 CDP-glycerol glycerophosphotransferase family protein [Niallia circulans]MED4246348.1 CDP-glycerol glycerophosphotransferase family protein [Niallia circulans]
MLRKIIRKLRRRTSSNSSGPVVRDDLEFSIDKPVQITEDRIIIQKEKISESLPVLNEIAGKIEEYIPRRKITQLNWNGPILEIEGYFYLEKVPMMNEDLVKKRLVLLSTSGLKVSIPLQDVLVKDIKTTDSIDSKYSWAGFRSKVNFATITSHNRPLPEEEYRLFLELDVHVLGDKVYKKSFPLGNIEHFLDNGFHSAKMEYFTARKEMKFNLLATYDLPLKTLKITSSKLKDLDPTLMGLDADLKQRGIIYRIVYKWCFSLTYKICKTLLPLQTRKIIFASDSRSEMSGNFQFVYDELLRRNLNYDYHLLLKKGVDEKKNYREIFSLAYHLATAKFIILDDFYPMIYPLKIRKNAELIQLWHAVGAFKTFGFSRLGRPGGPSPKSKNHRNYTKAIVSSHNVAKHYAEGFGIDLDKVIPTGIPRTDVFFDKEYQEEVRNNLYEEYPFLKGKKVITFAPTFRGNGQQSAHYPMEVLNLEKLYNELKDEYVFLFKIHPFVKNEFSIPYQFSDFFYDFSSYREINDLLFITDILITDYSSVCFEYALLNKPMIFFAYDVEEYVRTRDFYYDYHSFIPGPLAKTTEKMIDIIKKEDFKMEKIEPFVHYFFDDLDGKATERVVDQLIINNFNELL